MRFTQCSILHRHTVLDVRENNLFIMERTEGRELQSGKEEHFGTTVLLYVISSEVSFSVNHLFTPGIRPIKA